MLVVKCFANRRCFQSFQRLFPPFCADSLPVTLAPTPQPSLELLRMQSGKIKETKERADASDLAKTPPHFQ